MFHTLRQQNFIYLSAKTHLLCFALVCLAPSLLKAATETVPSYSQLAFPFQNEGDSARAIALGSAYVAVDGDEASLFWNPAGLTTLNSSQLSLHHNFWLQDLMVDTIAFATPQDSFGSWGFYASYDSFGNLQGRDSNGVATGNYNAGNWTSELEWAHPLFNDLSFGLGVKANLMNLSSTTYTNISGDFGLLWTPDPAFHLGASFSNWGTDVATYISDSVIRVGAAYNTQLSADNHALLAASFNTEPYGVSQLNFGGEDLISSFLALRAGYVCNFTNNLIQGLTGVTAGLGFHYQDLSLDYAYSPFGDLGTSQRLSLTYLFGEKTKKNATPTATPLPPTVTPQGTLSVKTAPSTTTTPMSMTTTPTITATVSITSTPQTIAPTPTTQVEKLKLLFSISQNADAAAPKQDPQWEADVQTQKDAIAQDPQNAKAWYQLGGLYYKNGQKEDAVQCYEQVLRLHPENQKLRDWLTLYENQGK
jgi:tetratricopeptide (TPR) repeat protein